LSGESWVDSDGTYRRIESIHENQLEDLVNRFQNVLFGGRIFLPLKLPYKSRLGETIPDGVVLSLTEPAEWFHVEIETLEHDVKAHILPQLSKIANIEMTPEDTRVLAEKTLSALRKLPTSTGIELTQLIKVFSSEPSIILVIDQAGQEVRAMLSTLSAPIHLLIATPFVSRDAKYGMLVEGSLPVRGDRIVLAVPTGSGVFGFEFLSIEKGRNLLPETGVITLKREDESINCQVFDTGSMVLVSVKLADLERLLGRVVRGNRLVLRPLLPLQVYQCEKVIQHG